MAAIRMNLEEIRLDETFKEKMRRRMIATNTCTSIKDKKDLNHELNKIEVFLLHKERIAKGEMSTKTFIKTYLKE